MIWRSRLDKLCDYFNKTGLEFTGRTKEQELIVSVTDTGVGISKKRIEKLFEISESYSTSVTRNEKGTGLGLTLCKEFIEKNNGKIWAGSDFETGSTFYFSLPLAV